MEEKEEEKITASEVMTRRVIGVQPSITIRKVAILMETEKIDSVVVIDGHKPVGIITERDIAVKVGSYPPYDPETKASVIMSSPVIYVPPEQPLVDVINLMIEKNIHKIPVVEYGKAVGIVTPASFLRLFSASTNKEMQNMNRRFLDSWN